MTMVTASPCCELAAARALAGAVPLAWPVVLSRAGLLVMAMADVVMVGRYDTGALAELSLGYAVFIPPLVAGLGCMVGIVSTAARGRGAGDPARGIALRGLRWSLLVGAVAGLLSRRRADAAADRPRARLVAGGGAVARAFAPGALFQIVFAAASFYLEGTGRMRPGLVAMIVGEPAQRRAQLAADRRPPRAPALGAEGAALASTLARPVMAAGLLVWMLRSRSSRRGARRVTLWGPGGWPAGAEMRRIGVAGGAAYFFETFAFASLAQAAGLLGPTPLAAYTILHNVEAMVFMIALGISVATAVRVGPGRRRRRAGRGALRRARRARRLDGADRPARAGAARLRARGGRLLQLRRRWSPAPRRSSRSSRSRWSSTPARWCSARARARSAIAGAPRVASSSPSGG